MAGSKETATFLTDAAHLLRLAAPETSAYLMNQRNGLLSQVNHVSTDIQQHHVCAACGNILIADGHSSLFLKSPTKKGKEQRHSHGPRKVVRCGQCERYSETPLDVRPKAARRKSKPNKPTKASSMMETLNTPKQTTNASSKKRAKNRKAGLQALLSGQQKQSGTEALKLSDFMR